MEIICPQSSSLSSPSSSLLLLLLLLMLLVILEFYRHHHHQPHHNVFITLIPIYRKSNIDMSVYYYKHLHKAVPIKLLWFTQLLQCQTVTMSTMAYNSSSNDSVSKYMFKITVDKGTICKQYFLCAVKELLVWFDRQRPLKLCSQNRQGSKSVTMSNTKQFWLSRWASVDVMGKAMVAWKPPYIVNEMTESEDKTITIETQAVN